MNQDWGCLSVFYVCLSKKKMKKVFKSQMLLGIQGTLTEKRALIGGFLWDKQCAEHDGIKEG